MTAERLFAWTAAVTVVAVARVGATSLPALPERPVALGLGAVAALPLAVVLLGWLVSIGNPQRGWN